MKSNNLISEPAPLTIPLPFLGFSHLSESLNEFPYKHIIINHENAMKSKTEL